MMITRRMLLLILLVFSLSAFSQSVIAEEKFAIAADGPQPMALVAKLAGIAPTSFYRHFRDMDELGLTLVEQCGDSLRKVIHDVLHQASEGRSLSFTKAGCGRSNIFSHTAFSNAYLGV